MWLDRLAGGQASSPGQSSPQSGLRSYSPFPRRAPNTSNLNITSDQPAQSPASSTLSLVSEDSSLSTSNLTSSRRPNGSSLRLSSTAPDSSDPFKALDVLLADLANGATQPKQATGRITEQDIGLQADFGGLSLQELASSQPPNHMHAASRQSSSARISSEADDARFDDLHRSIAACDGVLASVETNLANFRNDLAAVSADIEILQSRSTALNRRLEIRRGVEKLLGPLVEELTIPPETVTKISGGQIDDSWAKMLFDLDRRAAAHAKKMSSGQSRNKAAEELGPLLEKLTLKAIERIRDFLVAQIKALRSPHINAQIIQQQSFLKFKELFLFLQKHHEALAREISLAYMNTMRWYYLNQFSRYEKALGKLKVHILDKSDALGQEDVARMTGMLSTSRVSGHPHDAYSIGRRLDVLSPNSQSALPGYLAEEDHATHYLEIPFRNFNLTLVDNATAEYTFMVAFFSPALSMAQISQNFNYVFESTFELGQTLTKRLVSDSFDALGILICIRLNQHSAFELQRRKVPAVDGYINATNMLLWPRLQVVMDRHCESVRQLTNLVPPKTTWSTADQSKATAAPHVVTQRFGQLLHGFLVLSAEAGDDEPVVASLQRLRSEVEAFLTRQSQVYGNDTRRCERFLYNNYSLILTIIGDAKGKLAAEQREHFKRLKAAHAENL